VGKSGIKTPDTKAKFEQFKQA